VFLPNKSEYEKENMEDKKMPLDPVDPKVW